MTEFTGALGPDELYLSGRLQIDAAIYVLEMTEANTAALDGLKALRHAHDLVSGPAAMNDLTYYCQGGETRNWKIAIVSSAKLAEQNPHLKAEARAAAAGLLQALGVEV